MKKLKIMVWAMVLLVPWMGNACAQAPVFGAPALGVPVSTGPVSSGADAGWFGIRADGGPVLSSPRLFAAWSPNASSIKLAGTGSVYGDASHSASGETTIQWSTNGLWVGFSLPLQINSRLSTDLQAWYFFPGQKRVEIAVRGSQLLGEVSESGSTSGNLKIDTTWFAVDLEGSYHTSADFALIAGVRYDYLQAAISLPNSLDETVVSVFPDFRSKLDINLNSIFPYAGFRTRYETASSALTFCVKYFPWPVSVADVRPKSGYFAEMLCSYDVTPTENLSVSLFAKVDLARAVFTDYSHVANVFHKDPTVPQEGLLDQSLPVSWQQYLIGGSATLRFGLAFL